MADSRLTEARKTRIHDEMMRVIAPNLTAKLRKRIATHEGFAQDAHLIFHEMNRSASGHWRRSGMGATVDKLQFAGIARAAGFRTADVLGICGHDGFYSTTAGRFMPLEDGVRALRGPVFLKARRGGMRGNSCALHLSEGAILLNGQPVALETVLERVGAFGGRGALLERQIVQHPALAEVYSGAVNTLRIITSSLGGRAVAMISIVKFGRAGSVVDNITSGGIIGRIDPDTGTVHWDGLSVTGEAFVHHPDTGAAFKGFEVPFFAEAVSACEHLHEVFGQLFTIGWDVAVTPDGPLILEANSKWSPPRLTDADLVYRLSEDLLANPQQFPEAPEVRTEKQIAAAARMAADAEREVWQGKLQAVESSTSWKLTAPLRALVRAARRLGGAPGA